MEQLFGLQDLDADGLLGEDELVKLNEKIAMLHCGKLIDRQALQQKYQTLFRTSLDPEGRPVPYGKFRSFMVDLLNQIDRDPRAHEMILEQYLAEAQAGRALFHCESFASVSDERFLPKISFDGDIIE